MAQNVKGAGRVTEYHRSREGNRMAQNAKGAGRETQRHRILKEQGRKQKGTEY